MLCSAAWAQDGVLAKEQPTSAEKATLVLFQCSFQQPSDEFGKIYTFRKFKVKGTLQWPMPLTQVGDCQQQHCM